MVLIRDYGDLREYMADSHISGYTKDISGE